MATTRPSKADRENALKVAGLVTPECKDGWRENVVIPVAASEVVKPVGTSDNDVAWQRSEYWLTSLRPLTLFDNYLIDQIAISTVRIDRAQVQEQRLRERAAARAAACWDEDRTLAAEKVARRLPANPAVVRLQLRQSPQGCRWLITRWQMLVDVFKRGLVSI